MQIQENLMNEEADIETLEFEPTRRGVPSGAPESEPRDKIRYGIQEKNKQMSLRTFYSPLV